MGSRIAVSELTEKFITSGRYLRNWSERTIRTYRQAFGSFSRFQQSLQKSEPRGSLSKAQLEAWIFWMRENGVTPGGVNMYLRTMNSFLSWLKEEGHLEERIRLRLCQIRGSRFADLRTPRYEPFASIRPNGYWQHRTWTLAQALFDTGIRIEEALTLRTLDVDLDNTCFKVIGKGNKTRLVPFSTELRKVLFRYFNSKEIKGVNKPRWTPKTGH